MTERYKVLAVDDNEVNLKNAKKAMEELGLEVLSASSAEEAVEIIKKVSTEEDIFMVLSDMNMETKNAGMEVFSCCCDYCIPCLIVTGGGLDHGRPVVRFSGPIHYPIYSQEKETDRLHAIGHVLANEKTKEVWTEAFRSFSRYWESLQRIMGIKSFVEFVFETRKEYRKQKGMCITREEQLSFQAGIAPEMTDEYYERIKNEEDARVRMLKWEEEEKTRKEEEFKNRKKKDFSEIKGLKEDSLIKINEECPICGGEVYEFEYYF